MKDRILSFIEHEGITAAEFADKIGVQRSNVSHVLNGRNKPGFLFIQKMLETFPKLDSRWLLTGTGEMDNDNQQGKPSKPSTTDANNLFSGNFSTEETSIPNPKVEVKTTVNPPIEQATASTIPINNEKKVVKVLIFYDDRTFEDFRPA